MDVNLKYLTHHPALKGTPPLKGGEQSADHHLRIFLTVTFCSNVKKPAL